MLFYIPHPREAYTYVCYIVHTLCRFPLETTPFVARRVRVRHLQRSGGPEAGGETHQQARQDPVPIRQASSGGRWNHDGGVAGQSNLRNVTYSVDCITPWLVRCAAWSVKTLRQRALGDDAGLDRVHSARDGGFQSSETNVEHFTDESLVLRRCPCLTVASPGRLAIAIDTSTRTWRFVYKSSSCLRFLFLSIPPEDKKKVVNSWPGIAGVSTRTTPIVQRHLKAKARSLVPVLCGPHSCL